MKTAPVTMICCEYQIPGRQACMINDFHTWLDALYARRSRIKQERREMTITEKYALGGEA